MVIQAAPVYARHFHLRTLIDPLNTSRGRSTNLSTGPPQKKHYFRKHFYGPKVFYVLANYWPPQTGCWNTQNETQKAVKAGTIVLRHGHLLIDTWKRSYSQKHQGKYVLLNSEMYSIWFHTNVISPQSYEDKTFRSRSFLTSENSPLMCFHSEGLYV